MSATAEKTGSFQIMKFWLLWIGLVSYTFASGLTIHVRFEGEGLSTLRILAQSFNAVGYKLELESLTSDNNQGEIEAKASGNRAFTPSLLAENLKEQGIVITHAKYEGNQLSLTLLSQSGYWNIPLLGSDEGIELKKTVTSQWFRVEEGQNIRIESPYAGKWYPDIAVLDTHMGVLHSYRSLAPKEELQFELPSGAYYLKISNAQGMKVLKEGMWIESMSPGR